MPLASVEERRVVGTLYLVGTPIGNLEDITFRAARVLGEVHLIAAEDTRHSGRLLKRYGITTRQVSFHGHSPERRLQMILDELETHDVALISDAGMPAVSDPGADLVRGALERGFPVEVIPGPSAITSAVAISGLVDAGFLFAGYPPRRKRERQVFLRNLPLSDYPVVLFESPHRLLSTLEDLRSVVPEVQVAVCRELTKLYEEVVRGSAGEVLQHFQEHAPRGEFVLVLGRVTAAADVAESDVEAIARRLLTEGFSASAAARELASLTDLPRSEAYSLLMKVMNEMGREDRESGH
jgi:16S rRNA (cytidine1402-2'-O)-methyltransferase